MRALQRAPHAVGDITSAYLRRVDSYTPELPGPKQRSDPMPNKVKSDLPANPPVADRIHRSTDPPPPGVQVQLRQAQRGVRVLHQRTHLAVLFFFFFPEVLASKTGGGGGGKRKKTWG